LPLLTLTVFKNVRYVLITEDVVLGKSPALYWMRGDGSAFWGAWADEEQRAERNQV
jgi:ATP-dependent Clp protease ATP-binding subunit ClpX